MRPLTIDLHRLEYALENRDASEHYLDLESGEIRAVFPGETVPGADEKYDVQDDRFLHIEPLGWRNRSPCARRFSSPSTTPTPMPY